MVCLRPGGVNRVRRAVAVTAVSIQSPTTAAAGEIRVVASKATGDVDMEESNEESSSSGEEEAQEPPEPPVDEQARGRREAAAAPLPSREADKEREKDRKSVV